MRKLRRKLNFFPTFFDWLLFIPGPRPLTSYMTKLEVIYTIYISIPSLLKVANVESSIHVILIIKLPL